MADFRRFLDPRVLNRLARLELKARYLVEGFIAGMHRSPYRGVSVDFAQHREYVPGDDVRFVDWKVFAKSDRFYIKEFEEETNLNCHLFVDASESMAYGSKQDGETITKWSYATWVAAGLAHLLLRQRDSVGLALYREGVERMVPSSNGRGQLQTICEVLEAVPPGGKTAIASAVEQMADRTTRRGIAVLISDFFEDVPRILRAIEQLRYRGHEVILFHVLDRDEVEFPFERMTRFEGLEELPKLLVDPKAIREAYLAEFGQHREELRKACASNQVDLVHAQTDTTLDKCLVAYLGKRASRLRAKR